MGRVESGTLAALKALRREIVDPLFARHNAHLLLEFASVVIIACHTVFQAPTTSRSRDRLRRHLMRLALYKSMAR